ncbi:hypothetical protein [Chamaesiphon sp. VAR_48_metabat_403]|nr:hypothetical protein [Chamaesiphon sp. VAR_48_metabat_403]
MTIKYRICVIVAKFDLNRTRPAPLESIVIIWDNDVRSLVGEL